MKEERGERDKRITETKVGFALSHWRLPHKLLLEVLYEMHMTQISISVAVNRTRLNGVSSCIFDKRKA